MHGMFPPQENDRKILTCSTYQVDDTSGKVNNFVWWQWYPEKSRTIDNFPVKAGEFVRVTIETTSTKAAKM